jgi:hypothetical protein
MKTSPFYTGKIIVGKTSSGQVVRWDDPESVKVETFLAADVKRKMDDERIYVWPIFYKNFMMYSVIWPFFEINDVGWDIRPILSVDDYNKEYRILSGGWNNKTGSHYIFPFYVKTKNGFYSLPFSKTGKGDDAKYNFAFLAGYSKKQPASYLFPLYYHDGAENWTLTPISSTSPDSGYVLPFYFYNTMETKQYTDTNHYLFPPFGYHGSRIEKNKAYCRESYLFPLYNYARNNIRHYWRNPKYKNKTFPWDKRPDDYYLEKNTIQKSLYIFPTIYFSRDDKANTASNVVFPFIFSGHDKFQDNDNEWLTIFPFLFTGHDKDKHRDSEWFSIFPFLFTGHDNDSTWNSIFPFYTHIKDDNADKYNFMAMAGTIERKFKEKPVHSSYILPFYARFKEPVDLRVTNPKYADSPQPEKFPNDYTILKKALRTDTFIFPSFFHSYIQGGSYESTSLVPFYFKGHDATRGKDSEWSALLPFRIYERDGKNIYNNYGLLAGTSEKTISDKKYHSSYLLPFYNYDYDEIITNKRNPKYKGKQFNHYDEPDDLFIPDNTAKRSTYVFPSFFSSHYENGEYDSLSVFPFYFQGRDNRLKNEETWRNLFPFYFHSETPNNSSTSYALFAGHSQGTDRRKDTHTSAYFIPFFYHSATYPNPKGVKPEAILEPGEPLKSSTFIFPTIYTSEDKVEKEYSTSVFPVYYHKKTPLKESFGTPFAIFRRVKSLVNDDLFIQSLWCAYYYDRKGSQTTEYIFPSYYSYENKLEKHTVSNFFPLTFHEKTKKIDSFGTFLWLYTSRHYIDQGKSERQAFWYLYYNMNVDADPKTEREPYESARILWKLYQRETKGNTTNVDIFPFISYSKTTKRTKFSFAYRLFSVETAKDNTRIHLFFIPIWWK